MNDMECEFVREREMATAYSSFRDAKRHANSLVYTRKDIYK